MADDLGARLVQAGLVTPDLLADVLGAAPPHEGALVRALVRRGVSEDALAGFFVAAGFGPLLERADLASADPRPLGARMASGLVALPVRSSAAGLIVAMAAPTDAHALAEIRRAVGGPVLPVVARVSELWEALTRAYPEGVRVTSEPPPLESEPPVLELVRRRRQDEVERVDRFFGALGSADDEAFVPLVRHKPVAAPRKKVITKSFEPPSAAAIAAERRRSSQPSPPERSIIPIEHERWEVAEPPSHPNKVDPAQLRTFSSPPARGMRPPPIGGTLAAIRASHDRDEIVALACRGALTVCRASILLALRKGVLKGWDGAGAGLTRDVVRNLWIPTNSPSMFRDVVARGEPYEGPHRASAADNLFRAAVGSRGGEVSIQPVVLAGKTVAVFAADGVAYEREGRARIEALARAIAAAFERIIVESKRR